MVIHHRHYGARPVSHTHGLRAPDSAHRRYFGTFTSAGLLRVDCADTAFAGATAVNVTVKLEFFGALDCRTKVALADLTPLSVMLAGVTVQDFT